MAKIRELLFNELEGEQCFILIIFFSAHISVYLNIIDQDLLTHVYTAIGTWIVTKGKNKQGGEGK